MLARLAKRHVRPAASGISVTVNYVRMIREQGGGRGEVGGRKEKRTNERVAARRVSRTDGGFRFPLLRSSSLFSDNEGDSSRGLSSVTRVLRARTRRYLLFVDI